MNIEFLRWKKFKPAEDVQGWCTVDQIPEVNYEEINTCGFNVGETDSWVRVASSLQNNLMLNPMTIYKSDIIERQTFNSEEIVISHKVEDVLDLSKIDPVINTITDVDVDLFCTEAKNSTYKQLAKKFNISVPQCRKLRKQMVEAGRLPEITRCVPFAEIVDKEQFIKDYPNLTKKELAKKYNTCTATITKYIKSIKDELLEKPTEQTKKKTDEKISIDELKSCVEKEKVLIDMYNAGNTVNEISNKVQLNSYYINKMIKNLKLGGILKDRINPAKLRKLTESDVDKVRNLWNSDMSVSDIAKEFDVSTTTIYNYATKYGFEKRDIKPQKQEESEDERIKREAQSVVAKLMNPLVQVQKPKQTPWSITKQPIEDETFLYAAPELGGAMKFDPPINKQEFVEKAKTMDVNQLCYEYNRPPVVIQSIINYLMPKKTILVKQPTRINR